MSFSSKTKKLAAVLSLALMVNSVALPVAWAANSNWNNANLIDTDYDPFADEEASTAEVQKAPATMKERLEQMQKEDNAQAEKSKNQIEGVAPGHIYIPKGTKLNVELLQEASSKNMKKYQLVEFKMAENLIINGVVVIPKDTIGMGYVYEVQKAAGFGRKGVLRIAGKDIKTVNNLVVPLRMGLQGKGKTDGGAAAVAAAVSLVGGLFMKGKNVTYPAGTNFEVEVRNNVDLNATPENLAEVMDSSRPRGIELQVTVQ